VNGTLPTGFLLIEPAEHLSSGAHEEVDEETQPWLAKDPTEPAITDIETDRQEEDSNASDQHGQGQKHGQGQREKGGQ
jgi:hypothetical protein